MLALLLLPAAMLMADTPPPDPVLGWPLSPLKDLPALPKTHLTWGIGGVPYNASSPTLVDYARITHSLPFRVPLHGDSKTFRAEDTNEAELIEAVKICARPDVNATLNLNWSPWYYYYNCTNYTGLNCKNDPRVTGPGSPEAAEIALFTSYLTLAQSWVTAANRLIGANVKITSVALDSEKFAFANAHHAIVVRTHSPASSHLELAVRMMACRSDKGPVSVGHSRVDW
jgi:hypothetical protein